MISTQEAKTRSILFYIHNIMKFIRTLVLLLALLLSSFSMAETDSVYTPKKKVTDYIPMPIGFEIGGRRSVDAR